MLSASVPSTMRGVGAAVSSGIASWLFSSEWLACFARSSWPIMVTLQVYALYRSSPCCIA